MKTSEIKNIIWDWNGTLLDDITVCIDCMNVLLTKREMEQMTVDYYREVFTFPVKDYLVNIGFDFTREPFEIPADEFVVLYNTRFPQADLYSEVRPFLQNLGDRGFRQFILSAQEKSLLLHTIEHYGLTGFFESITGTADNYAHSKAEAGLHMMADLKLEPDETIMIGDTVHDFEVASLLGIRCILISRGHQSPARLRATGAPVIETFRELPPHLNHSGNH
jgi:phosphoglycolate phosphatase